MEEYKDRNWLKNRYIDKEMSMREIARLTNSTVGTICNWIHKYDIPTRTISEGKRVVFFNKIIKRNGKIYKICPVCGKEYERTEDNFFKDKNSTDGLACACKECRYKASRDCYLKRQFNISSDEYNELFNKQECRCIICNIHQSELTRKLAVDHNHKTGKIRGLLCDNCNRAIGLLKDDPEVLERAFKYLSQITNVA